MNEEIKIMNISNHCLQRYHERVKEAEGVITSELKERYIEEISKMYAYSKHVFRGIIGHSNSPVDVYVNQQGWVIMANDKEQVLITLYKVDLNVDNEEINKQFIKASLDKIDKLQNDLLEATNKVNEDKRAYEEEILGNEAKIKEYRKVISDLETRNEALRDLISTGDAKIYQNQIALRDAIENYAVKEYIKVDTKVD